MPCEVPYAGLMRPYAELFERIYRLGLKLHIFCCRVWPAFLIKRRLLTFPMDSIAFPVDSLTFPVDS